MTTTSNRLWPALAALTGLGTLAVTASFRGLDAVRAAGPCMDDGSVLRFELATTMAQLSEIFGPPTCAPLVKAGMDAVNHQDIAAYIPTYTAFCICAAIWLGGRLRTPLVLAAIGAPRQLNPVFSETGLAIIRPDDPGGTPCGPTAADASGRS